MGFEISISVGNTAETSHVTATGRVQRKLTSQDSDTFRLGEIGTGASKGLRYAVWRVLGKTPPWVAVDDHGAAGLYKKFGWSEVQTVLIVESAKIVERTSQPVALTNQTFTNKTPDIIKPNAELQYNVSETIETNWSHVTEVGFEQSISYAVEFLGTGGSGETSLSFNQQWGKGGSKSKETTIGTKIGFEFDLKPQETRYAELSASQGTLKIEIIYKAYLTGQAVVHYPGKFHGHYYYAPTIESMLSASNWPNIKRFTETIYVGFYSDATMVFLDEDKLPINTQNVSPQGDGG